MSARTWKINSKRLHVDEKTAERYIAHAIEPMRRWGFIGSGTQAA